MKAGRKKNESVMNKAGCFTDIMHNGIFLFDTGMKESMTKYRQNIYPKTIPFGKKSKNL